MPAARVQRGDDTERCPHSGPLVDDRRADAHAGPVRLPGDAHDPAERLQQRVVPRTLAQRSRASERADVAVDEARITGTQLLGAEAEPRRRSGPQALEKDVRRIDETEQNLAPALEIEGN